MCPVPETNPCLLAMVFVCQLTKGDANYTFVQVSVSDVIMIFAFAPIAAFLLGVSDIQVPLHTLLISVTLYVLVPLIAGIVTRLQLHDKPISHPSSLNAFLAKCKPWSG